MTGTKTVITHKSSLSNFNGYNTGLLLRRLKTTLQSLLLLVLVGPAVKCGKEDLSAYLASEVNLFFIILLPVLDCQ